MDPTFAPSCDFRTTRFRATAVHSCGARLVRVVGVGLCPSAGWRLDFVAANGGIVPDRDRLWLAVRETAPDDTEFRAATPTEVEGIIEDCDASAIVIVIAGRDPIIVPVLDAPGAGIGVRSPHELARR